MIYLILLLLNISTGFAATPVPGSNAVIPASKDSGIMDKYPELQKFVSTERETNLLFGFGLSPLTLVNGKIGFSASLFQVHWLKKLYDIEVINAAFGKAFGSQNSNESFFLLRAVPKARVYKNISVGPMVGLEFVYFPDVSSKLTKNSLYSPASEFSTTGVVYGGVVTQTLHFGNSKTSLLRISEMLYKETYSVTGTNNGWSYYYDKQALNVDPSPIAASTVFAIEISYLY